MNIRKQELHEKLVQIAAEYTKSHGIEWDYKYNKCVRGFLWGDYTVFMSTFYRDGADPVITIDSKTMKPISLNRPGYYPEDIES